MVLSIPGKGSGCTPTWLYIWASISNLRSATLATISSIFTQINSVSPLKFFWECFDLILPFFVYENSGKNFHMVVFSNMADRTKQHGGRLGYNCILTWSTYQMHADLFRGLTQISFLLNSVFWNNLASNSRVAFLIWTKMSKRGGNCSYLLVLNRYLRY